MFVTDTLLSYVLLNGFRTSRQVKGMLLISEELLLLSSTMKNNPHL